MFEQSRHHYQQKIDDIRNAGLSKDERIIASAQGAVIRVGDRELLNFCANNYLGLANDPRILDAARAALDTRGFGLSSVRFICGTQDQHATLEQTLSHWLGYEDTVLYSSCFDANGGLFHTLLDEQDAVISDALNHASIIDGIRLCKARRLRYRHSDMADLEKQLQAAKDARVKLIATDGVFSMDGDLAKLDKICELADQYDALVMVDDSHATGFVGPKGRGTPAHFGVDQRVDILTSTLGKALGGAAGGFVCANRTLAALLRNTSRPYLFSNSLAPVIVAGALAAVHIAEQSDDLREKLKNNTRQFRAAMTERGFDLKPGTHPIVPIMLEEASLATQFASQLLDEGIYVIGFSYPVVPKGQARIRVQLSASHETEHVDRAVEAFSEVGRQLGVIRA